MPFPVITTERLILRRIKDTDAQRLYTLRSDPETMKYIPRPVATKIDDVLNLIKMIDEGTDKNDVINWAVTLKDTDALIGTIGFFRLQPENDRGEVGYMLGKDYQGKGIMHEALKAVLDFGFETLKFHSIFAVTDPENKASISLLEKNEFVKEGHFRHDCFFEGRYLDSVYYSLIR